MLRSSILFLHVRLGLLLVERNRATVTLTERLGGGRGELDRLGMRDSCRLSPTVAVHLVELAGFVRIDDQVAALAKVDRRVGRQRDQRQAEDVAAQRKRALIVASLEQMKSGKTERCISADAAGRAHAAVGGGCEIVHEPALCKRAL